MTISNVLRCEGRCEDVASVFDAKSKHWTGRRREHWRRPKAVGEILKAIIFWPRRSMNVLDKHLLHNQFMVHHTLLHVVLSRFHFILMICKLFTFLSISFCLDPHTWIVWKQGQCQHVNVGWIYLLYPFTALLIWSCPWCMSSQRGQFSCSYWYFHHTLSLSLSLTEPSFEDISIFALLQPEMSQEKRLKLERLENLWFGRCSPGHHMSAQLPDLLRRCNPILNCLNCGARPWSQAWKKKHADVTDVDESLRHHDFNSIFDSQLHKLAGSASLRHSCQSTPLQLIQSLVWITS